MPTWLRHRQNRGCVFGAVDTDGFRERKAEGAGYNDQGIGQQNAEPPTGGRADRQRPEPEHATRAGQTSEKTPTDREETCAAPAARWRLMTQGGWRRATEWDVRH